MIYLLVIHQVEDLNFSVMHSACCCRADEMQCKESFPTVHEDLLSHVEVKCCAATAVQDTTRLCRSRDKSRGRIQIEVLVKCVLCKLYISNDGFMMSILKIPGSLTNSNFKV